MNPETQAPCPHCGGTGQITIPSDAKTAEVYYFGCRGQAGHYWFKPHGSMRHNQEPPLGYDIVHGKIDSGFCPGSIPGDSYGRSRPEVEGEACLHHLPEWTILAWWDRSVDIRGGCNSNLVAKGHYSYADMIEIGKAQFPDVMSRQRVPLKLVES